jgi:hypothetical protein
MAEGKIVVEGSYSEIKENPYLQEILQILNKGQDEQSKV